MREIEIIIKTILTFQTEFQDFCRDRIIKTNNGQKSRDSDTLNY